MSRVRIDAAGVGLGAGALLVAVAVVVPRWFQWPVHARTHDKGSPPLHAAWEPGVGWASLAPVAIAVLAVVWGPRLARTLSWRTLMAAASLASLAWMVSLALVDGVPGLTRVLGAGPEYLGSARAVDDIGATLQGFTDRIAQDHPRRWPTHVAGHPPGALLFFVLLDRVGLGGDLAAALVVVGVAATIPVAVATTVRLLGAEQLARRALPFVVFAPSAVLLAVSADAVFTATAAWGLCALAAATQATRRVTMMAWAGGSGLLFGALVMMSYGLPLVAFIAVGVLLTARTWRPLLPCAGAALTVVLVFSVAGFSWWEAFPVLRERYLVGLASVRPGQYWIWANLAALAISAGPALTTALGHLAVGRRRAPRVILVLVGGAALAVLVADVSLMSKAEVERIWLPFVPWLLLATAALPRAWVRPALTLQVGTALALQHLFNTFW